MRVTIGELSPFKYYIFKENTSSSLLFYHFYSLHFEPTPIHLLLMELLCI